jgi:hypothetical protein
MRELDAEFWLFLQQIVLSYRVTLQNEDSPDNVPYQRAVNHVIISQLFFTTTDVCQKQSQFRKLLLEAEVQSVSGALLRQQRP